MLVGPNLFSTNLVPHCEQNVFSEGSSFPHLEQNVIYLTEKFMIKVLNFPTIQV